MISKGETSIEKHINNSERKKCKAKNEVGVIALLLLFTVIDIIVIYVFLRFSGVC